MKPVHTVEGRAMPLWRADIDTDQIVPSEALKHIGRRGFGRFLFGEWREDPDFVLNRPEYQGARILLAGPNFGCGSSREHAPWALQDYGFGAVVAPSFADIFKNNCTKVGLLTVELPAPLVQQLISAVEADPHVILSIDLDARRLQGAGLDEAFPVDDFTRHRLLHGLDDIGLTLTHETDISQFEAQRSPLLPRLGAAAPLVPGA
jgi:3-isopropylmalate/(R)-2-methylmalate dehydratase small subunit